MSLFKSFTELFQINAALKEKEGRIKELDSKIANKDQIVREVAQEAKRNCENLILDAQQKSQQIINDAQIRSQEIKNENTAFEKENVELAEQIRSQKNKINELKEDIDNLQKKQQTESNRLYRVRDVYKSVKYAVDAYPTLPEETDLKYRAEAIDEWLTPSVTLHLHSQEVKDLKKRSKELQKQVDLVLSAYEARYTTKTAKAMYQFMVLALRSELQNILFNLRYDKLEKNLAAMRGMIQKFSYIAADGHQGIAPTIKRFLLQMESLFEELIKTEYEYYIQQERIKEEQRSIRERIREEAAERKELEQQQKQLEKEGFKYTSEIDRIRAQAAELSEDDDKQALLRERIKQLEEQIEALNEKREEIIKRQNGQAGYVYVISNLGAFGVSMFKVGMTRRLNPQERINELGDASVPFPFDVHCMVFSDNAVQLEKDLHAALNERRVNKVNYRKEFFRVSINEIEELVGRFDESAAFTVTMLAEQYRQTLAIEQGLVDFDPDAAVITDDEEEATATA